MPWDFRMPPSFRNKPGSTQEAVAPARWQSGRRAGAPSARHGIAAEAGEAAWHHHEAFEQLRARVEFLNARIESARAALSGARPDLFDGLLDALDGLKAGIASMRAAWQGEEPSSPSHPRPAWAPAAASGNAPPAEADPWDGGTAEALTRIYQLAAL